MAMKDFCFNKFSFLTHCVQVRKPEAAWGIQTASLFILVDAWYDRVRRVIADERLIESPEKAMMAVLSEGNGPY